MPFKIVCGVIFSAVGADRLQAECDKIGHCDVGSSVITEGYDLPARNIIHTVGRFGKVGETERWSCFLHATLALLHLLMSDLLRA